MQPWSGAQSFLHSFFLCAVYLSPAVLSAPTVDVSLNAAFPSPPFLLELLECAATENSTAYFPLINTIASGRFNRAGTTDQELYQDFESLLQDEGHITDENAIASWRLALAARESAPRIEAQYQLYRTTAGRPTESTTDQHVQESPAIEVFREGKPYCEGDACGATAQDGLQRGAHHSTKDYHFDRTHGDLQRQPLYTIYADLLSIGFPRAFQEWRLKHTKDAYRIRYKPSSMESDTPLTVSGYGVELALKRTDYIVIDDREAAEAGAEPQVGEAEEVNLDEHGISDLKPLSSTELRKLALNTASFIMSSKDPLKTLQKVSQDFPKHASALVHHNVSKGFMVEHRTNRDVFLRSGANVLFLNGQQVSSREIDAFTLLDKMRRERKLVDSIQDLGLSALEAVNLLQHPEVATAHESDDVQRYDFRDTTEGGGVILWLNDIEKDKRYAKWSPDINAFLQRMFPGQFPSVRKDTHNVIYPLDFSNIRGTKDVVETLEGFVKRLVPVRFGIVPIVSNEHAAKESRIVYHLAEAYGLSAAVRYLKEATTPGNAGTPDKGLFDSLVDKLTLRKNKSALSWHDCMASEQLQTRLEHTGTYLSRLGANNEKAPLFVNGVPIPQGEAWMQAMSQQLSTDLRVIQQAIFTDMIQQDDWLPSLYMKHSSTHRDPLLIPEDEKDVKIIDLAQLYQKHDDTLSNVQPFQMSTDIPASQRVSMLIFADLNAESGAQLVLNATEFAEAHDDVIIGFVHQATSGYTESDTVMSPEGMARIQEILMNERPSFSSKHRDFVGRYLTGALMSQAATIRPDDGTFSPLESELGILPGEIAVLVDGRLVGPLPESRHLTTQDFETLLSYERKKRREPVLSALKVMGVDQYLDAPFAVGKLSSIVALSTKADVPEGIFEGAKGPRMNTFEQWSSDKTRISVGDPELSSLQLVASIDPASDVAQKWISLLATLSEVEGVYLRIFLNPADKVEELPIKRFYRQVLSSSPRFGEDGSLVRPSAEFAGLPEDALLTMTMDVPPSWHVAPKESVYDLDNIKLSSLKAGTGIQASYELEHIMIEGHSRESYSGSAPRGAQLVLSTGDDPNFDATIVMANLGYFQFKANPGVYELKMQQGASDAIFSLDSAGTKGYLPQTDDSSTEISLYSFKGTTVFPRLSRKPGMEAADVLEYKPSTAGNLAAKGAEMAQGLLAKAGLPKARSTDYIAKGFELGQNVLSMAGMKKSPELAKKHADINIFSVASGHLYERMLNIMMLSVMRHTNHTVKFWFIEQFLSPSFKTFLPTMASTYNFDYQMVSFKWPHWLRAQTEKQRVIWGYKILFLDVLFPLDLDEVIFVDADQIVRTDMYELVQHDLEGAPYGFTPMCDSRTSMEGYRFWKQGYWANFLRGLPYHISALYVVDLKQFRAIAAGDRLRQQYQSLSADPNSLSNLDQDLPNHMQMMLPIHSLPQEWLWCETWCSDESLKDAKTIDLCNNPETHEPKLERARRQVPEWTLYDEEIAGLAKRTREEETRRGEEQAKKKRNESDVTAKPDAEDAMVTERPSHRADEESSEDDDGDVYEVQDDAPEMILTKDEL